MRLKVVTIALGMVLSLLSMPVSKAVYGGIEATGSPLVLTLLSDKNARASFCSMALLSERIVVTAAHCVIEDQGVAPNLRWNISNIYVSQPGADVRKDDVESRIRVLKVVTRDDFINTWRPEIKDYRTQIHDIAFLFLEKPLIKGYSIPIATDLEIEAAIAKKALVSHYGYGLQAQDVQSHSPWMTQLPLVDRNYEHLEKSKVVSSQEGPTAMCPGDSGGPWYIDVDGVTKIAAVLVAASGCRGNPPYNGGTLGTRIAPYMELANLKWNEFITAEQALIESQAAIALELESKRNLAIKNGTYVTPGGCHFPGIKADLESQDSAGNWVMSAQASGWIRSDSSCPTSHSTQPWTVIDVPDGTKLRWRFWQDTWQVYGDVFTWKNLNKTEAPTTQLPKSAISKPKNTITCVKGKLSKKVSAVKPKCPTGWKVKR